MASPHFTPDGDTHMVDVSDKPLTVRVAVATGEIVMRDATATTIRDRAADKGDVLAVARLAGISATKWTQHLIPLCHSIPIESVTVDFAWPSPNRLRCTARVQTTGKTGIEMEAMTAVSVACLTVYDMVKSIDRAMTIGPIQLNEKSGGASGHFVRATP